ncbi:CRISPR-associated protein [Sorangium cellulosum]|uniref:CRISPR-associated protein n=1 Tax=Sorangium cellulosum TaxID=56 RepID=A0A4P2PTR8_SORCE|nr:type I-U CRISPR-associated protein Csb2 [Sorangium cellulosum]AUX19851.1 CRISPR-associated protein [Sorangium cellulosum]
MLRLAIRFLSGSYHATPWSRHVNEGDIEWPPSPWRLYRALLATGFARLGWTAVPPEGRTLIERLAASPPVYHMPPASTGHTRHYMPLYKNATAKVLDAFAFVGRDEGAVLGVTWEVEPTEAERALFAALADRLSYLGRAESWVAAEVTDALPETLSPCRASECAPGPEYERIALLAPLDAATYAAFRRDRVSTTPGARQEEPARRGAKAPKKGAMSREAAKLEALYPVDLLAALLKETGDLQREGWSQPPGSRWLSYWRERDALAKVSARAPRSAHERAPRADTALLALASDTTNGEVLPRLVDGLLRMEVLHAALVRRSDRGDGLGPSPCLTGKDARGEPRRGHGHAWLLPASLERNEQLDHVLVHAAMKLDERAYEALSSVRVFYWNNVPRTFVTLVGLGVREDFEQAVPYVRAATVWKSVLPFVPPRHLKRQGANSLEGQVQAELASRNLPPAERIEVEIDGGDYRAASDFWDLWQRRHPGQIHLAAHGGEEDRALRPEERLATRWRHFRSARLLKPEQRPPVVASLGLRLTFAKPVRGPIALGYASHFGLGVMAPER